MAIGRISGALLFSDLDRQSIDLAFTTNGKPLTYMDFTNFRFGVNTNSLVDTFTVSGTANISSTAKVYGNLVAASGIPATDVNTGAFNVVGGAGITGNLYAGNIFANNFDGNISNSGGTSVFGNIAVTYDAAVGSLNTANAVITGGYIGSLTNAYITTSEIGNFSTANAVVSGGYISGLANATIITGNVESWYAAELNSSSGNIATLAVLNFSSGNVVLSGGYISSLTNAYVTTSEIVNFSTANAVVSGGYISGLANATITTGNVESWYAAKLNTTNSNIVTAAITNLSTGNAVISGGYITALSNASISTANLGSLKIEDITLSSLTGNVVIQPLLSNPNAVVTINSTSALQLPSGATSQQPIPVYAGAIRWNSTTNNLEVYNGTGWQTLLGQISNQVIVPDGISSIYTLDNSTVAEGIIVSINGTLQQPGVAYTVAGTQITFAETPLVSDVISIRYIASGTVTAENSQEINSGNIAIGASAVLIDSFNINQYRSAKYMTSATADSGDAEFAEFAVTQFAPNVAISNVNRAVTGSSIAIMTANISGSIVQVYATASSSAQMRLQKTYFII